MPVARARAAATTGTYDFLEAYVADLPSVIDMAAIASAGVRIGADPLGGASVAYWGAIGERYGLDLTVVNPEVDPTWRFMTLDWDEKIRMDCSSPYAMASLIPGGTSSPWPPATMPTPTAMASSPPMRLMNPNHFLAVAIEYLFAVAPDGRPAPPWARRWCRSSMIDRVAGGLGRRLLEVPVGFKWFVAGLLDGSVGFGGEESAGASFLRQDGSVLDDGQGRDPPVPTGLGDPGGYGRLAERALPGPPDRFGAPPTPAWTPRPPGKKKKCWRACAPRTSPLLNWRASPSRPS